MRRRSFDYFILITTLILVAFGLIMVLSASYYTAETKEMYDYDGLYFFKRQCLGAGIGLAAMLIFSLIDYHKLKRFKYVLPVVAAIMLAAVLIPGVGREINGSSRWIYIGGFSIQPSEIAKFALILFIAAWVADNRERIRLFVRGILPPLLLMGIFCALLILQPNFSAVICLCLLAFIMLFVGGARGLHLGALAGLGGAAGAGMMIIEPYRMQRIASFLDPWADASGDGYQVIQSLYAIGAGGLFGRGLGNARQKLLFLPFSESDFIFSIVVEELGFMGAFCMIALFVLLALRGIRTAVRAPDMFGMLMATGIVTIISIQVIINIAVVTSSIPATGVSLPFISYGSSSLIIFMSMIGVLLNISRQSKA